MSGTSAGRPRSESSRVAILDATIDLLLEGGFSRLTLEGIAARAHVGRQTLYRWWASKDEIVAECITDGRMLPTELLIPSTGNIRADMTSWLTDFAQGLDEEHAASRARLLTAATAESEIVARAFNEKVAGPYRAGLMERLQEGIRSGELKGTTPVAVVADSLLGATLYSVFLRSPSRQPIALLAGALLDGIADDPTG